MGRINRVEREERGIRADPVMAVGFRWLASALMRQSLNSHPHERRINLQHRKETMKQTRPIRSEMGWSTQDAITVRGFDLPKDLLGKIDLGGMAFLEITGRMPNANEAEVFNALLITLVEHGMTPQAISARLIHLCAPEALQAAVAAGLCGMGSRFGGGSEQVAQYLQAALKDAPADADLEALAAGIVEDFAKRKTPIPGIGHPLHKPIDPRTPVLFAIAERNGFRGRYVALLEAVSGTAERKLSRPLPINAPGAIGAILCELGFPWQICRGIAVISRAVGLVGHIAEEMRNPIAREIYERAEHEVTMNATTSAE
jgi:citrate synthase